VDLPLATVLGSQHWSPDHHVTETMLGGAVAARQLSRWETIAAYIDLAMRARVMHIVYSNFGRVWFQRLQLVGVISLVLQDLRFPLPLHLSLPIQIANNFMLNVLVFGGAQIYIRFASWHPENADEMLAAYPLAPALGRGG
jgi:hypothetical protein